MFATISRFRARLVFRFNINRSTLLQSFFQSDLRKRDGRFAKRRASWSRDFLVTRNSTSPNAGIIFAFTKLSNLRKELSNLFGSFSWSSGSKEFDKRGFAFFLARKFKNRSYREYSVFNFASYRPVADLLYVWTQRWNTFRRAEAMNFPAVGRSYSLNLSPWKLVYFSYLPSTLEWRKQFIRKYVYRMRVCGCEILNWQWRG